jgi:hypothetical protein
MINRVAAKLIFRRSTKEHIAHQQAIKANKTPLDFLSWLARADDEK